MHYDSVLAYVQKVLENRRISCMIYEEPFENVELLDHGLRESLYKGFDKDLFSKTVSAPMKIELCIITAMSIIVIIYVSNFPTPKKNNIF